MPLKTARQIDPPDWMTDYRCVKVMRVLGAYEQIPQALFVGGCVRNLLLGKPVRDIDIATIHKPLEVIERLKNAGIRYVPTGLEHGTVTAVVDDGAFEVTTLRKDIETDGRHAVISFSSDWREDAARRDFTINTLLAAPGGRIFDPTEKGLQDLEARHVRFVGQASERISEDYLRIFRFFRFHAQLGMGSPDAEALEACTAHAANVSKLSRERVSQEFLKIIEVSNAAPTLKLMVECGVVPQIAGAFKHDALMSFSALQVRHDAPDMMARLFLVGAMTPDFFNDMLVLSNAQKRHLQDLSAGVALLKQPTKKKIREAVYKIGNQNTLQAYLLRLTQKDELPNLDLLDVARYWQAPTFPIKAEQLIDAGVSRGPLLGNTLKTLEAKWVAKDFPAEFAYKK